MSTSLAEQLQHLAVPQTSTLQRDKKRASLLFDPKEAAGFTKETIYQIGLEGLAELIQRNQAFSKFESTLFHVTSKTFERSVQNNDANEKLDANLRKFLLLLSPYFLLNCCHKALEWLINRFSIHEYNREELLMLCLPYHESNIFIRVILLLKFRDTRDSFYFLKQLQKPGTHLPKQSLLNHAASNSGFLKFVSKYIKELLKIHEKHNSLTIAFNFYCTVFTGALEYSGEITEDQISQLLPLLLKGLNSSIPDFCAASYVITARLVSKTNLSNKLLDTFVEKISEVKVPGLKTEACLVLLVIYQSQKSYKLIPPAAVANLSEKEWLPKVLFNLQNSGSYIYPFFGRFIGSFINEGVNNDIKLARDMITACLDYLKIKDEFVAEILQNLLEALHPKLNISAAAKEWLTEILQKLENQYPTPFDKEVYKILSTSTNNKSIQRRKLLSKLLKNSITYKDKFDLFNKLYHPNSAIRGESFKFILTNFHDLRETDRQLINSAFIDRLRDDDVNVVKDTLKIVSKISQVDRDGLKNSFAYLCMKYQKDQQGWGIIYDDLTSMLTSLYAYNDWEIFLLLFPFVLPNSSEDLPRVKKLLETPFFAEHVLLKNYLDELKLACDSEIFIHKLLIFLSYNDNLNHIKSLIDILKLTPNKYLDNFQKYTVFLVLTTILPNNSDLEYGNMILEFLQNFYNNIVGDKYNKGNSISGYIKQALKGKFPVQGYLHCLTELMKKIKKPNDDLQLTDFSLENEKSKYYPTITKFFLYNNIELLKTHISTYFTNYEAEIEYFLNISISTNSNIDNSFKVKILNYIKTLIKTKDDAKNLIFTDKSFTAFMLVLLLDIERNVREIVLEIFEHLISVSTRKGSSNYLLINSIIKNKEEILIDQEQLPLVLHNTIDPIYTKDKKNVQDLSLIRNSLFKYCNQKNTPGYLKSGILEVLFMVNSFDILEGLSSTAMDMLEKNPLELKSFDAKYLGYTVAKIDSRVIGKLNFNSNSWRFIQTCIKNDKILIYNDDYDTISPSPMILNQLDREVFNILEDVEVIKKLLDSIIEISSTAQDPEVLPAASKIFKHIDLDSEWIMSQLILMRDMQSPKLDEAKKKRRISVVPTVDILDTLEWKKGVTVLEFIQDKKKIRNTDLLLPILFDILKRCLDFDEQSAVEYPKQLVLSLILHCCTKMEGTISENIFNVELIVQCIRASQNPQTHHHALLVLAHTAHLIPTQVLHHIMAIFTFMGSSVLRHDDAYSFQIISKIIDTVIPIIISNNEDGKEIGNIAKVLRVFVDALLDVPEHRRMPLYKQLLERIDVEEHLYIFLLLIFESQVAHASADKQRKDGIQKRLDKAAELSRQFTPAVVIYNCIKLVKYLHGLPDEKEENMDVDNSDDSTFNISTHTPKDFRHFKYILIKFTSNLLGSPEFVNQVAALNNEEELKLESLFKDLIVNILQYIQRISKVSEKNSNTPQAQYWKVMLHLSYDVLDSVNALVTSQMFLLVTKGLMLHKLSTVRRRILELLNNKLQFNQEFFEDYDKDNLYSLIPPIITIIESIDEEIDNEQETIIQTALLSLKLLVKSLAVQDPEKFIPILEFISDILKSGKAQNNVLASVMLCLAELCVNLKGHAISSLPNFMPALIKILKKQKHEEVSSVLLKSLVTTFEKILDSMPLFLSPYLEKLLTEVSILVSKWSVPENESKVQPFTAKLNSMKQKIGSTIPLRILLPSVENCYNNLIQKTCYNSSSSLMDILAENISNSSALDINSNLNDLTNFFLNILKFRTDNNCTLDEANMVEDHIVRAFTVLILKLSENTFRPLYYKLYDWAVRSEDKSERLITFYNLSNKIAQSLKGLFVLFAGHFINNAAQILNCCNKVKNDELYFEDDTKNTLLLENILSTLNTVFLYDSHKFVNRDRFEILMQPLVDQLENTLNGVDALEIRNQAIITPCLVHFSVATDDDALWKQMNYQILLKMRHNMPKIRLATLHCITEIVKRLGEDFLPLLPETIPFLAELLEDEEEDVEKACQKAIQEMEKVLGEPLQKYF